MERTESLLLDEAHVARRIALAIHVARPRSPLADAIPGMFIVEFLRRGAWIRRFRDLYMAPRQRAMAEAAGSAVDSTIAPAVENGLHQVLVEHYRRLLSTGSSSLSEAIRAAYGDRASFNEFLLRLDRAEQDASFAAEPEHVRDQRERHAREVFQED